MREHVSSGGRSPCTLGRQCWMSSMHRKDLRKRLLSTSGGALLVAAIWFARDTNIDPYRVRFCRVSTTPPHQIYYRGHYRPVAGGRVLDWLEGRLSRLGLAVNLVHGQQFNSFGTNWCVLLGITGRLDGGFVARVKTADSFAESRMTGAWSTTNGKEHLVFWSLKPTHVGKGSTIIEILHTNTNTTLARHKL